MTAGKSSRLPTSGRVMLPALADALVNAMYPARSSRLPVSSSASTPVACPGVASRHEKPYSLADAGKNFQ